MDNIKQEDIEDICFNVSQNIILPKFKNLSEDDIYYKNLMRACESLERVKQPHEILIIDMDNIIDPCKWVWNSNCIMEKRNTR